MKPAPFEYYAPTSVEQALTHLSEHGYDAKVLAGGQSLIPMMNFRLAQPSVLIDINNAHINHAKVIHEEQSEHGCDGRREKDFQDGDVIPVKHSCKLSA